LNQKFAAAYKEKYGEAPPAARSMRVVRGTILQ
jgi:hypothetical protein